MNKFKLFFVFLFIYASAWSQESSNYLVNKANRLYHSYNYSFASKNYCHAIFEDLSVNDKRNMAISLWKIEEYENAQTVFLHLLNNDLATNDDLFDYALLLKEMGHETSADSILAVFVERTGDDIRKKDHLLYQDEFINETFFEISELSMNSTSQDFGAIYYEDKLVFVSGDKRALLKKWKGNNLPYLNVYISSIDEKGNLTDIQLFDSKIKRKYNEGPVSFSNDIMVYTSNRKGKLRESGKVTLGLYMKLKSEGQWQESITFPYNSPNYSCGQPAFSQDGKWLYFVSDMPGGIGGTDLYKCEVLPNNLFGEPINMGPKVNTEGNEMFPFISKDDKILFFSSDGRKGYGGLDVFAIQMTDHNPNGLTLNLGFPINSNKDDFSFILKENGNEGYLSSNRNGGEGSDDIYKISQLKDLSFQRNIKGQILDNDGDPIENAVVEVRDENNDLVEELSIEDGKLDICLLQNRDYTLLIRNSFGTLSPIIVKIDEIEFDDDDSFVYYWDETQGQDFEENEEEFYFVQDQYYEKDRYVDLLVGKDGGFSEGTGKTDASSASGDELGKLNSADNSSDEEMNGRINDEVGNAIVNQNPTNNNELRVKNISFPPVYFDYDEFVIRTDAAQLLDKMIKVLNENPELKIELRSYTDSRGASSYNERLSKKRMEATLNYLRKNIVNPERINGNSFGERNLVNDCDDDTECTSAEHQLNRRTEFVVLID